jgi:hypothetical protein
MSSFNDIDLFGSGPHRFSEAPLGEYVLVNARVDPFQAGSQPIGPLELTIIVRGRLVADSENDLWALRDAIAEQLTHPPQTGALKEGSGRDWEDISFVNFTCADRTDRGRKVSISYTATFTRFAT